MTVVNIKGEVLDQTWRSFEGMDDVGFLDLAIVSLADLRAHVEALDGQSLSRVGVRLTVDDTTNEIVDHAKHLGLIELVFSQFKDGRPFSTAATLRRDYGFTGDLRASGDILPDQALFLARCGFSSIVVPRQFTVEQFKVSLEAYSVAYQPATDGGVTLVRDLRCSLEKAAAV